MSLAVVFFGKSVLEKTVNLTPTSRGCVSVEADTQCTVSIELAPKKGYIASVGTYDALNGTGHTLSTAQNVEFSVKTGKKNIVSLTLSGIPAQIVTSVVNSTSFNVVAKDADGNTIVGPGAPSFTASKTSGSTVASIVQPTKLAPNTVTVALASPRPVDGSTETIGVTASYAAGSTNACAQTGAVCTLSDAASAQAPRQLIFVTNYSHDNILGFEIPLSSSNEAPSYTLTASSPFAMTADAAGNLFVPGYSASGPLYEFSPPYAGATVTNTNSAFHQARGAAVDSHGNLFFGNNNLNTVTEVQPPYTGAPAVTVTSGVTSPQGVAVDTANSDTLYVGTVSGLGVYQSSDYTTQAYSVTLASPPYDGMLIAGGKLFIGENSDVEIFTLPITSNTPTRVTISANLSTIPGLAVDAHGNLFVANFDKNEVLEYTTPFSSGESPAATITSGVASPWAVGLDALGNLYVVNDTGPVGVYGSLEQFDPPFSNSSTRRSKTPLAGSTIRTTQTSSHRF